MSDECRALGTAIRLRLLVHRALDREDWRAVAEANEIADAAYLCLTPTQARQYIEWAKDYVPDPGELVVAGCEEAATCGHGVREARTSGTRGEDRMKFYDEELAKLGCGDGGCIIHVRPGMHTNGGCHCLIDIRDVQTRQRIFKALHRYREIVDVLANAKLVKDEP